MPVAHTCTGVCDFSCNRVSHAWRYSCYWLQKLLLTVIDGVGEFLSSSTKVRSGQDAQLHKFATLAVSVQSFECAFFELHKVNMFWKCSDKLWSMQCAFPITFFVKFVCQNVSVCFPVSYRVTHFDPSNSYVLTKPTIWKLEHHYQSCLSVFGFCK